MKTALVSWMKRNIVVAFIACLALGLVACGNDQLPQLTMDSVSIYTDLDANAR